MLRRASSERSEALLSLVVQVVVVYSLSLSQTENVANVAQHFFSTFFVVSKIILNFAL